MLNYIEIEPIVIGLNDEVYNAITWTVNGLIRHGTYAVANYKLFNIANPNQCLWYDLVIPQEVLELWLDDSVIDDYIIASNNKFVVVTPPEPIPVEVNPAEEIISP